MVKSGGKDSKQPDHPRIESSVRRPNFSFPFSSGVLWTVVVVPHIYPPARLYYLGKVLALLWEILSYNVKFFRGEKKKELLPLLPSWNGSNRYG